MNKTHSTKLFLLLLVLIALVLMMLTSSCESKSGISNRLVKPPEKVVILDSEPNKWEGLTHYKVYRLANHTSTWIYDINPYERGDTIIHRFAE